MPATRIVHSKRCPEQALQHVHVHGTATADYVSLQNPLVMPNNVLLLAESCHLFDMAGGKHNTPVSYDHPHHQHQTLLRTPF